MQYDDKLIEFKNLLPNARNILIALPTGSNIDKLASALSLYLALTSQGKQVSVVCEDNMLVGQSHLFAIDKVQKSLPASGTGDFVLTVPDVASNGTVPALEKLDYFVEGTNLNLVFKVLPGQTFSPTQFIPKPQVAGGNFNLSLVIGAPTLNNLGSIYNQNPQAFSNTHLVNIDNQAVNTNFGQTNIVDSNASSISEMVVSLIGSLSLPFDQDTASNLLAGIFEVTSNLTSPQVSADTFMAVANCLRVGGRKPAATNAQPFQPQTQPQPSTSTFDLSAFMPKEPIIPPSASQVQIQDSFITPPVVSSQPQTTTPITPSPEERPAQEHVVSESEAEPDWLTPKIYKGTSIS